MCSVRLPIDWFVSGPMPPSIGSTSSCFKCVVEDSFLTDLMKSWYELESESITFPPRINMHYPFLILKLFTMANDTMSLCFGMIVMSL